MLDKVKPKGETTEKKTICASPKCKKERPMSGMKICMDSRPSERYVCDMKCMIEFYK